MDDFQDKLNSILGDPQMMSQIMNMAQSFTKTQEPTAQEQPASSFTELPKDLDLGMMQKIASFAGKMGIDRDQQNLLHALRPYLSSQRIGKLEKAMRSAKIAAAVTGIIGRDIF